MAANDSGQIWTQSAADPACFGADWEAGSRPVTDLMVSRLGLEAGHRVVDLASGKGEPALTFARIVGPEGSVLGFDVSEGMVDQAAARAMEQVVQNVEFRLVPSEDELDLEANSFDGASCRFGIMFMRRPVEALSALRTALKPGRKAVVSTWEISEFAAFRTSIVERHTDVQATLSAVNPLAFNSAEKLVGIMESAGFRNVIVETVRVPITSGSDAVDLWDREARVSPSLRSLLEPLSQETRSAIREEAIAAINERFPPPEKPLFWGVALVAGGQKAYDAYGRSRTPAICDRNSDGAE